MTGISVSAVLARLRGVYIPQEYVFVQVWLEHHDMQRLYTLMREKWLVMNKSATGAFETRCLLQMAFCEREIVISDIWNLKNFKDV